MRTIIQRVRDYFRGYSDADMTNAIKKTSGPRRPGQWIELTNAELKALVEHSQKHPLRPWGTL